MAVYELPLLVASLLLPVGVRISAFALRLAQHGALSLVLPDNILDGSDVMLGFPVTNLSAHSDTANTAAQKMCSKVRSTNLI